MELGPVGRQLEADIAAAEAVVLGAVGDRAPGATVAWIEGVTVDEPGPLELEDLSCRHPGGQRCEHRDDDQDGE
jgi:hypothetical protein